VVVHNHPSGNKFPSASDKDLTQKLKSAAALMDIQLLDHLIITPSEGEYYSFADEGIL
jgi:DNA repair protein RadC